MQGLRLTLVATCLSLVATVAAAQDVETDQRARQAFQQGADAYADGRFDAALEQFERAYELSRRPRLLFNIGVSAQRALRTERAISAFEDYLRALPEAPNREEVETRLESLRGPAPTEPGGGTEAPEPSTDDLATPEDLESTGDSGSSDEPAVDAGTSPPQGGGAGVLPWIVMGASLAVAAGGGVLFVLGRSDIDQVESVERGSGTTWSDVSAANDRAPVLTGVGIALMGVGVAGAAVGAILLVSGGDDAEADVAVAVGPSGVAVNGRF